MKRLRPRRRTARATLAALLAGLAASQAYAHDSWLDVHGPAHSATLALGTGERFPQRLEAVSPDKLLSHGCRSASSGTVPLGRPVRDSDVTRWALGAVSLEGLSCWAQITPVNIELPPAKVLAYFEEIRPGAAILQAWQQMQQQGSPFRERFAKSARYDAVHATPALMPLVVDVLRLSPAGPLQAGQTLRLRLLRQGQPLAAQSVQVLHEQLPRGLWLRTDAAGEVSWRVPLPGRWLLRGTALRLADAGTGFESDFLAYVFDVAGP